MGILVPRKAATSSLEAAMDTDIADISVLFSKNNHHQKKMGHIMDTLCNFLRPPDIPEADLAIVFGQGSNNICWWDWEG